jgi:adenylate cyclase
MERRLAAIMAADVVDYSRLMGEDEGGTLAALLSFRAELFNPTVSGFKGRVIKSMGDGWLAEFPTVAGAVNCAIEVQQQLAGLDVITLRMGIDIGDVAVEAEDAYSICVNVAARLEAFTTPGTVAISGAVYSSLDGTLKPGFEDAGSQQLKNIDQPVQIWIRTAHRPDNLTGSHGSRSNRAAPAARLRPIISFAPVSCSDGRDEILELADALTSDVSRYLRGINWLSTTVSNDPGAAAYIVHSILRGRGDKLRLETNLRTADGAELWSDKFDGNLEAAFEWQDEVGGKIASMILMSIAETQKQNLDNRPITEMSAEECELLAQLKIEDNDLSSISEVLRYASAAIEKDPMFTDAYALAVATYLAAVPLGYGAALSSYSDRFERWVATADGLKDKSPFLEIAIGIAKFRDDHNEVALSGILSHALQKAPNNVMTLVFACWSYVWLGMPQNALDCAEKSISIARYHPWTLPSIAGSAVANVMLRRYAKAIQMANMGLERSQNYLTLFSASASAYAHMGPLGEAHGAADNILRLHPGRTLGYMWKTGSFIKNEFTLHYAEGLKLAGIPE